MYPFNATWQSVAIIFGSSGHFSFFLPVHNMVYDGCDFFFVIPLIHYCRFTEMQSIRRIFVPETRLYCLKQQGARLML